MSTVNLFILTQQIENMQKNNHLGILRILMKKCSHLLTENKNGIHVNLSDVDDGTMQEICEYVDYVRVQEVNLSKIEEKQESVKSQYF